MVLVASLGALGFVDGAQTEAASRYSRTPLACYGSWQAKSHSSTLDPDNGNITVQPLDSLDRYTPYALAALRIVTALIFIAHGTQKLFGFPAPPASGLPALLSLSGIGGIIEFAGGLLILIGLFTRPVAFLLSGRWPSLTGCSMRREASTRS